MEQNQFAALKKPTGRTEIDLQTLEKADRQELNVAWKQVFNDDPPKHLSIVFMQKVLVWEHQRKADGDISKNTRRAMSAIAEGKQRTGELVSISSGSQLVREWNGRRYQVDVTDSGYVLDCRTFASLTAVAKHITGTNWSGPRFFGLNKTKGLAG